MLFGNELCCGKGLAVKGGCGGNLLRVAARQVEAQLAAVGGRCAGERDHARGDELACAAYRVVLADADQGIALGDGDDAALGQMADMGVAEDGRGAHTDGEVAAAAARAVEARIVAGVGAMAEHGIGVCAAAHVTVKSGRGGQGQAAAVVAVCIDPAVAQLGVGDVASAALEGDVAGGVEGVARRCGCRLHCARRCPAGRRRQCRRRPGR